jgi:hypothetical protein
MVRNIEKLLKIESPKRDSKLNPDTIEVAPEIFGVDLINIEPYVEPETTVRIDLELDQLEDLEE